MSGETVSLRAIPGTGYGLDRWVDGSGTDLGSTEVINVTMDQAKTIKAVFSVDPSYVNVTVVGKGELTFSETPTDIEDNKYTFVAGVPLTITATPEYGFIAKKENWKIDNVDKVGTQFSTLVSTYLLAGTDLVKNQTLNLQFTFDSITDRVTVAILTDTIKGKFTFSPEGENLRFVEAGDLDTILVDFPKDVSIKMTAVPGYSYSYSTNKEHTNGNTALDIGSDVKMDKNYVIEPTWARLTYKQVIINNDDPDGRLEIDDPNQDYSSYEEEDKYPINYKVRIRIDANQGFQLASITGPSWELSDEDGYILVTIPSDTTTIVYVTPEFAEIVEGVQLLVNQNFQSGTLWPENEGTVSNVPGAISYLGLSPTWDPRTLSIDEILKTMVKYRAEGSLYDYNEGPSVNGKPYPPSSLDLVYSASPLTRKIPANVQAAGRSDSLTFTLANYAPCNNCLNYKAVKEENLGMKWLGRITPGTIALKNVTSSVNEKRSALGSDAQPFMSGDTVGVMIVDGFAYVEKVEVGFASGTGGFCPSVYYNIDGGASVDEQGRFQGDLSSMTIIGYDRALRQKRPDRGEYGWGSAQEGMLMDQNMYVSESDVDQTQIVILPGYEVVEVSEEEKYYKYTQMFIHDLKIWGSAKQIETPNPPDPTGVASEKDANNKFYMLGSTNVLKVDVPNAKTLVIYNEMGTAVKVIRGVDIETVELPDLKQGVYFVHCYNTKGERVSGSFIKINN
jgi:hypothetical protein